jgi:hypothetical protein
MIVEKTYDTCVIEFEEPTKLESFDLVVSDDIVLFDVLVAELSDNNWRPLFPLDVSINSEEHEVPFDIEAGNYIVRFNGEQPTVRRVLLSGAHMEAVMSFEKSLGIIHGDVGQEVQEIPIGVKNGSNTNFTISFPPIKGSVKVIYNGAVQTDGVHYVQSETNITLTFAPEESDDLLIIYTRRH